VVSAVPNAAARKPSLVLEVDFGPAIGLKRTSAQLTELYRPDELVGRQVAAVVNFPPRQIAKVMSEVLVLGFPEAAGRVVLVQVERSVPNGGKLF
jgi:tRNA-binding protein